jgi:SAM-dependent methyltransferase
MTHPATGPAAHTDADAAAGGGVAGSARQAADPGAGPAPLRVNLGCGGRRVPGFLGVDRFPAPAVDLRADLTRQLPFADDAVAEVLLDNVIEHIADIPALMQELHRVCHDGAEILIRTPHFTSLSSWRDPTHVHHLSYFSMDHFEREGVAHYTSGGRGFRVVERRLSFGGLLGQIGRLIFTISPLAWEKHWCFVFRGSTLSFRLRVLKPTRMATG